MRIGTWNLDGRPLSMRHRKLLVELKCDVWLLTELSPCALKSNRPAELSFCHVSSHQMARGQYHAGVLSNELSIPLSVPHGASAMAEIRGVTYCATVLPRATCGGEPVWLGANMAEKQRNAIQTLLPCLRNRLLVWGGDWNQNLSGGWENVGTKQGQRLLCEAIEELQLQVPTADLLHQNNVSHSIDHICVPCSWNVLNAERVSVGSLSDHDAFVVEVQPPESPQCNTP
jgi:hypothetical protein